MKIRDGMEAEYSKFVDVNSKDGYSLCIVEFAKRYAERAEELVEREGKKIAEFHDELMTEIDRQPGMGITGFMAGAVIHTLSMFWVYGEELRRVHNAEYGVESATGVVNPAILSI